MFLDLSRILTFTCCQVKEIVGEKKTLLRSCGDWGDSRR